MRTTLKECPWKDLWCRFPPKNFDPQLAPISQNVLSALHQSPLFSLWWGTLWPSVCTPPAPLSCSSTSLPMRSPHKSTSLANPWSSSPSANSRLSVQNYRPWWFPSQTAPLESGALRRPPGSLALSHSPTRTPSYLPHRPSRYSSRCHVLWPTLWPLFIKMGWRKRNFQSMWATRPLVTLWHCPWPSQRRGSTGWTSIRASSTQGWRSTATKSICWPTAASIWSIPPGKTDTDLRSVTKQSTRLKRVLLGCDAVQWSAPSSISNLFVRSVKSLPL